MTDYFHDFWLGYLTDVLIRQTVEMSILKCPGCQDELKSPLLHLHHQLSLLEKLRCYIDEIRGTVLPTITVLYDEFQNKLPHSDDLEKDKEIYVNNARFFLLSASAETLYYGRYLTEMNDQFINEAFVKKQKAKKTQLNGKDKKSKKK